MTEGEQEEAARTYAPAPRRPADRSVPPGASPRPPGRGWLLTSYDWDERTGVARVEYENPGLGPVHWTIGPDGFGRLVSSAPGGGLRYQRRWKPQKLESVDAHQPAGRQHQGWTIRPPIDRDAALARYHEALRVQRSMPPGTYAR